ncbi:stage II sporulation protein M, partial [Acinetobacter baumannii]
MGSKLLTFTAGHAILELSAIFISGGAGLLVARAMLFPGQLRRVDALKSVFKDAMGLFAGCVPLLLLAGLIEGFISPRTDLSSTSKVYITFA